MESLSTEDWIEKNRKELGEQSNNNRIRKNSGVGKGQLKEDMYLM